MPVEVAEVERQGRPDQEKRRDIRGRERLPIQLRGEQEVPGRREELEQPDGRQGNPPGAVREPGQRYHRDQAGDGDEPLRATVGKDEG